MNRESWRFEYSAPMLAEAARERLKFHTERLEHWRSRKDEVLARIRSEGIEVEEKAVLGFRSPKERDWQQGAKVMVRNDLRLELDECLEKLAHHTGKCSDYAGWAQALSANMAACFALDIEDWLYFFEKL